MEKPQQLGSAEAIKRRSNIHAIIASYMGRDETVTKLIANIPELADITKPNDVLITLLYEPIEDTLFSELAAAAKDHLKLLSDGDRIDLLKKAALFK